VGFFTPERGVMDLSGRVLITSDGGHSWQRGQRLALTEIDVVSRSVAFGDALHGLWETSDAGLRWRRVGSIVGVLSFADPLHGWVITSPGRLEGTADGGRSFVRERMPQDCEESHADNGMAISRVSADFGYLGCGFDPSAGEQIKFMYITRDGGRTWRHDPNARFRDGGYMGKISFSTPRDGLLYLARGGIFVTHDGGRTWTAVLGAGTVENAGVAAFQHFSGEVIALLGDGSIVRLGEHRGAFHTLYPRVLGMPWEVSFSSAQDAIGIGDTDPSVLGKPGVLATSDGGRTWHVRSRIADLSDLVRVSQNVVYATATDQESSRRTLLRTDSDGRTWHRVALPPGDGEQFWTISFPTAGDGVLSEDNGRFYVTHDGARSWALVGDAHQDLRDFAMLTGRRGFAVYHYVLLETLDGGATWHRYRGVVARAPLEVATLAPNDVWVSEAGPEHDLLRTTNGGTTWQRITFGREYAPGSFVFLNPNDGYGPAILTTDGGRDWTITSTFTE
jgi:photosystem II stability/assembly factor-like uncharacterized protein